MPAQLQEAIDFAITNGLLKYNTSQQLIHAPFSLTPCQISRKTLEQMMALTPLFNLLMLKVGQDKDFLVEHLERAARTDTFLSNLLDMLTQAESTQPHQLLISRSDYLLTDKQKSASELQFKQVEFNTISNSFVFLSRQLFQLHRFLYRHQPLISDLVFNDPMEEILEAIAAAIEHYDKAGSCMLMVVQPGEQNVFDQRAIEYNLFEKHDITTLRLSLEEIAEKGVLKEGHLKISQQVVALTYFRAGYTPHDFTSPQAWQGRNLIEASDCIKVPSVGMQLAGAKKIQQVLGDSEILQRFMPSREAQLVQKTFAGLYTLDETINGTPAYRVACRFPDDYVLKPQREGGGNNLYQQEMVEQLQSLSLEQRQAYILMERIQSPPHSAILVVENKAEETSCISEIGRYGVCFSDGKNTAFNRDTGYLVRTKAADENEGGVCAGFACLNSLCLTD